MKVLVTGAKGFIGSAIIERLRREEIEIFQLQSKRPSNIKSLEADKSHHTTKIDITDLDEVLSLKKIGAIDAVIHAAGLAHQFDKVNDKDFWAVNVKGTENILELCRELSVRHLILISSVSVYGNTLNKKKSNEKKLTGISESSGCFPADSYAASKLESENAARRICEELLINLTILRLTTVIGEEDGGNFLRLIKAIDRRRFFWIGKGTNYKSLIHREDAAGAAVKILKEKRVGTEIFNVAAEPLQMKEIVEIISQTLKKSVYGISVNEKLVEALCIINSKTIKNKKIEKKRRTIEKWLADDVYSSEHLKQTYKYEPVISVKEAITREVAWYLKQK